MTDFNMEQSRVDNPSAGLGLNAEVAALIGAALADKARP